MPELPEVETVRDGLARHVIGQRVTAVSVLRDYSVRRHDGGPESFVAQVLGQRLTAAVRRGKYLWLTLEDPETGGNDHALLAHLGMSGQLLVAHAEGDAPLEDPHRHMRVRLALDGPAGRQFLDFVDQRTFGYLAVSDLVPTPDGGPGGLGSTRPALPGEVSHIGRDLLDPTIDLDVVVAAVRKRRSGIKRALLDQVVASGIGNIYADEALWRTRMHYDRACDTLRPKAIREVFEAARDVMTEALVVGGTTFDSLYVNVNGESGYFSRSLAAYGREGEPCNRCGDAIVREQFMNRSAFRCPTCQRAPRG